MVNGSATAATVIFICLLGATKTLCSSSFPYSRVIYITPNNVTPATQDDEQLGSTMDEILSNFTLQEVLQNYEMFFTSNTKLQLFPGIHEVSESFGSVIVKDIYNFAIVGTSCISDSDTTSQIICSEVECIGNSSLGFSFMNSSNITVSKFHFSKCGAATLQLENDLKSLKLLYEYDIATDHELQTFFESINKVCNTFVILATYPGNITVENMTFKHPTKSACFATIGVTNLSIRYSKFWIKCFILTLDSLGSHRLVNDQTFTLSDLSFMPSLENIDGNGLHIEFHQAFDSVEVFLERATFQNQGLKFAYNKKICRYLFPYRVAVQINKLTVVGNQESCHGLVIDKTNLDTTCYDKKNVQTKLGLTNSQFIQSNVIIMGCKEFDFKKQRSLRIEISNVLIKRVPCTCDFALSADCTEMTIQFFTLTESCCKYNLASFDNAKVGFDHTNQFTHNNGTCISAAGNSYILFSSGNTTFSDNISEKNSGSTVIIIYSVLEVSGSAIVLLFKNNTGMNCGGITGMEHSRIIVRSFVQFINNRGYDGGALALYSQSTVEYRKFHYLGLLLAKVQFIGNSARHSGGAIFIAKQDYEKAYGLVAVKTITCAFAYEGILIYQKRIANLTTFVSNTASYAGSAIYGGWIDICDYGFGALSKTLLISSAGDPSVITSNPTRVCVCIESTPQCNITDHKIEPLYPGQSFQIEVVAVGQRFGTTPAIVLAAFVNNTINVDELQKVQSVDKFCTSLNYTVKSPNDNETLQLDIDTTVYKLEKPAPQLLTFLSNETKEQVILLFKQMNIMIPLQPCPLGYGFDRNSSSCVCKEELQTHGVVCDTKTYSILRASQQWINATFKHIVKTTDHGVLVHKHCPLDYCINADQSLNLERPSDQCNFNRSGILCGSCQGNLSHILGSNKCKECSLMWAILVIPVFILLGIALVVLIILLNLTVAQGTVNALIFYANIVSANQATFFPTGTTNTFFRWYIAWLNLDIGVETCFISGLDAYTKTWLQFLFPLYIWFLVIAIIMASRRSTLAARLSGENAVPALGTLFLLSYTKLLRIIITTFSSTQLEYPDGYIRRVWLYDGNVDFLEAKHVVLFITALLLLVLISAPYTLVLLTIQWLQRLPYHCLISWVWQLKPLFDAHTSVHKEKHRYWPGLLLLIRVVLFVAFSLNFRNDPALNLLITSITSFCLLTYLAYLGGVYKTMHLNILEYIFLLNLGILSAATLYIRLTNGDQDKLIKSSVSIALFVSLLIFLSHIYLKVKSTRKGSQSLHFLSEAFKRLCSPIVSVLSRFGIIKTITRNNPFAVNTVAAARPKQTNTHSSIELKEPLLVQ